MNNETPSILEARHISKRFIGVQALDDVSVAIKRGEIRCLAGENGCGKSTFVKTIAGVNTPDQGEIILDGKKYSKLNTIQAIQQGVQVIYQDLSLFDHLTVADNIAMNKLILNKKMIISRKDVYEIAQNALDFIGVKMDLDTPLRELSIANHQLIAISRAISLDARLLFMDEPTTALTKPEVDKLLSIVEDLRSKGLSIVFISHKLDEVFKIADSITIFRDGKKIGDFDSREIDHDMLVYHMTGRKVKYSQYMRMQEDTAPVLEVKGLSRKNNYKDMSFSLRQGDILGLTGLLGSGRTELALSLFGLNKPDGGTILFNNKEVRINNPQDALDLGISLLPEDRSTQGLFMSQSIRDNISSAVMDRQSKNGLLNNKAQSELAENSIKEFSIRAPGMRTAIKTLSGGNQQKASLAKWVASNPKVFILDTPTVGVDVGSKSEIYDKIQQFAREGMAVILISDEIEEILANCNRVQVIFDGSPFVEFDETAMKSPQIAQEIADAISGILKAPERTAEEGGIV